MSHAADIMFGVVLSAFVAVAGRVIFGEVPGVALWRVLFFGLSSGFVFGYFVALRDGLLTREQSDVPGAITPRRHR
jgi:hypothetical protein